MRIALFSEVFVPKIDGITNRLAHTIECLLRWIHNHATLNLCPSRFTQRELRAHGVLHVGLWRGGVDTRLFHPGRRSLAMRARLSGGRPESPLLLYAARLSPEKRIETLAFALEAVPGARLALVGDGPARAQLGRVFQDDPVTFTGFLRGDELAAAFASADIFVMPSCTETLGFVTLEAMASGCPVVAAGAGATPDLVAHGENGLLYDPEHPAEAGAALKSLLAHPSRMRFLAQQARKFAEGCTWQAETLKLVASYREAIRMHRRRSLFRTSLRAVQASAGAR
jgi:glycosyltransferase involved in cell wall biosynthesis